MRIAILGAGRVGTALGQRWADLDHEVVYGVRAPGDARDATLAERAEAADAVIGADAVVVALP